MLGALDAQMRGLAAHPARTVLLLPYAQLLPLAARLWAEQFPAGFMPRLETTRSWAARAGLFAPGPTDISFDHGRDLLAAASLLHAAGLAGQRGLLAGPLVEQATALAGQAASLPPALRPDWAARARAALPPAGEGPLALEAALGRTAIAWAAASDYATDALFEPRVGAALDALFIVPGLQPEPLTQTLAEHFFEKAVTLSLPLAAAPGALRLHTAADGEDEAERAAACVLRHLAAGRAPVALVAGDRVLTRRISALLGARGVALRDETGWRLSTTHAAAEAMATLRACAPAASSDDVLDALKLAPAFDAAAVRALEARLRRDAVRGWPQAARLLAGDADLGALVAQVEALRAPLHGRRSLAEWAAALRALLHGAGQWARLSGDAAGSALIAALGLADAELAAWRDWPAAQRRMPLAEFTRWAGDTLEAATFKPPAPAEAPVHVVPLSQLLGRPFAALVLPGADEQRLPAAPLPGGPWTEAQRAALQLPTRAELQAERQAAWQIALAVPQLDVLWRRSDDSGEPLLPSPLVQAARLAGLGAPGAEPRELRAVTAAPVSPPAPSGAGLPVEPLSASAYDMLRACPYRFFALRQLGLQESAELDVDADKRDFGNWVHEVLRRFHEALSAAPGAERAALIDAAAEAATRAAGLEPGEFLPFAVAWPALREGYLSWLAAHEAATGAVFEQAEQRVERAVGGVQLHGTFDRVDRLPDGAPLVIDYKTERRARSAERLKAGHEDTQLPFYALLTGHGAPQAAYLNVSEREPASLHTPPELLQLAAALHEGIRADLARIAQGEALRPLGEGSVCDWCAARGLCRKDFW